MAARFPVDPFSPDRLPDPSPAESGVDPVFPAIYRAAVSGADAYRATRIALRRDGPILRLGNRFVPIERYREIAFLALGRAAVSQALAASTALGEALTQGFVVGPDPLPPEVPFRSRTVPPRATAPANDGLAAEAMELAQGLGTGDLLLVLLSAGSAGYLSEAPPGFSAADWSAFQRDLSRAGASSREVALLSRVLGRGAVGGRLSEATRADVAALVVDRGDGADLVGGGPTRAVTAAERTEVRSVLARVGLAGRAAVDPSAPSPDRPLAAGPVPYARPVTLASPADGLRDAGDAAQAKRWKPMLAELHLPGGPDDAADRLVARTEALVRTSPATGVPGSGRPPRGLLAFAATTLDVADGEDEHPAMSRFMKRMQDRLPWREASVGLFQTAGAAPGGPAPGLLATVAPGGGPGRTDAVRSLRMRSGITDVGLLAVVAVPNPRE